MSIARAIGHYLLEKTGVPAFADETAHQRQTLPCLEVALVSATTQPTGAGRWSFLQRDEQGTPTHFVKRVNEQATVRVTAKAPASANGGSAQEGDELLAQVQAALLELQHELYAPALVDPKTGQAIDIYRVEVGATTGPVFDGAHEPRFHVGTVQIDVWRRVYLTKPVARLLGRVRNRYEVRS